MREHYDFSDAIKNPFAGKKEKGKFNVLITYNFVNGDDDAEQHNKQGTNERLTLLENTLSC